MRIRICEDLIGHVCARSGLFHGRECSYSSILLSETVCEPQNEEEIAMAEARRIIREPVDYREEVYDVSRTPNCDPKRKPTKPKRHVKKPKKGPVRGPKRRKK
jgi:hypothetical protein